MQRLAIAVSANKYRIPPKLLAHCFAHGQEAYPREDFRATCSIRLENCSSFLRELAVASSPATFGKKFGGEGKHGCFGSKMTGG